ncbi:ABC transporter substrate-binding protein [Cohnella sp.]|uniref:ABC transporter substrate-binding protein n=1 Tax=Cohnella sp. TaxID=1883426 RepID=UPI00356205BB
MKKVSHSIKIILLVFVIAALIVGCSNSNGNNNTSSPAAETPKGENASPATEPEASELKPYEITLVMPGAPLKDHDLVIGEMNKILKEKINATLNLHYVDWGAWGEKTNLMFASSEPFDLIFSAGWFGYTNSVGKGNYMAIDDLVEKYGQAFLSTIDPEIVNAAKVNGKLYAMVASKEFAADKGLTLNKALVEKYNFDLSAIKELADMEPLFKTIKENEPDVTPFLTTGGGAPSASILDYGYYDILGDGPGELLRTGDGLTVINKIEDPKYMEYAKLMRKWYLAGYVNKDAATVGDTGPAFRAGKAFAQTNSYKPGWVLENEKSMGMGLEVVQIATPFTSTTDATSALIAFSRTSKDPERAMMFMNLLYSDPKLLNLLINGIEGTHYVVKEGNIIDFAPGLDAATSGYPVTMNWMIGNLPMTHVWASEDPNKWQSYIDYNNSAEKSRALGFAFNTEPVKNEIAAASNVEKEFKFVIVTGSVDPEEYIPKYLEKLKAAGMDKIIAEKQKQLDEWAKTR